MIIFFTTTLAVSIVGLVSLIALKRWELSRGRTIPLAARPQTTEALAKASLWLEHHAPALAKSASLRAARRAEVELQRLVARGVLLAEGYLERALSAVRGKTQIESGEASAFLREVSAHKKALQELSAEERTYEE